MKATIHPDTRQSLGRALIGGMAVSSLILLGVGGWAVTTTLSGAVIASGLLVVDTHSKKVQHPSGGVISELHVREGSEVRTGDVLVRLDDTITRANLAVVTNTIDELAARQARLRAEQGGRDAVSFPQDLTERKTEPAVDALMDEEVSLFELRRSARGGQKAQMNERIGQLREQIHGMADQIAAKQREIELIDVELTGVRELFRKNLVPIARLTSLEREAARLQGERGALAAAVAQANGKITETELQIMQIDQDLRSEVGRQIAEIRGKLSELVEKRVAAEDHLRRIEIRAPQDGIVHQLAVHTVGGVISPGEPLMLIVPRADELKVEARIAPQDIDQVRVGQEVVLRFSAFNQRTTPELKGEVSLVSADVTKDDKNGASFYTVRIIPSADELNRLGELKLVPGMPVESFIRTAERTVASYLTKPLQDQIVKAWREK